MAARARDETLKRRTLSVWACATRLQPASSSSRGGTDRPAPHTARQQGARTVPHLAGPSLFMFGRRNEPPAAPSALCSPACSPTGPLTTPSCPPPRGAPPPAPPAACTRGSIAICGAVGNVRSEMGRSSITVKCVLVLALAATPPTHSFLTVPAGRARAASASPGASVCPQYVPALAAAPLRALQMPVRTPDGALRSVKEGGGETLPTSPAVEVGKPAGDSANPMAVVQGQADTVSKFMNKLNEYKACTDKEQR